MPAENRNFHQVPVLCSLMPENKKYRKYTQLSEYLNSLFVALAQVKLSAVKQRLFFAKITKTWFAMLGPAEIRHFQQDPMLWSLMPENEIFKEESQLSEYITISLVAYVQVKLSAVEVRLFKEECLHMPNSRLWDQQKIIIFSKFPYSDHVCLKIKHLKKSLSFQKI